MNSKALELLVEYLDTILAVGGAVVSVFVAWWRFTKWVGKVSNQFEEIQKSVAEHGETLRKVGALTSKLTQAIHSMSQNLNQREKDVVKIEGALELSQRTQMQLIGQIEKVVGSLDGVWRTLQAIHPERVPKRASDRY